MTRGDGGLAKMLEADAAAEAAGRQAKSRGAPAGAVGRGEAAAGCRRAAPLKRGGGHVALTSDMNFLQMGRISLDSVALNIMTCLSCGVILKMSCTSPRMSARPAPPPCQHKAHSTSPCAIGCF